MLVHFKFKNQTMSISTCKERAFFSEKLLNIFLLTFLAILLQNCKSDISEDPPVTHNPLYRISGTKILNASKQTLTLQGIAFGNEVWSDNPLPYAHHSEIDYARVKDMGMNAVRFYLNYKTFEDDANPYQYKQSGWDWLNQNITWAKKNGIFLILNMHVPQGGFQSNGGGDALWNTVENQNRLTALWKEIAKRYKDEAQIIGFGLVNEPSPSSDISQWQQLAQRLTNEIRMVDKNHLLFIERANYVKGKTETADYNFPSINDSNVVYEFHMYNPFEYTHQLFSWANQGDGGSYPDETYLYADTTEWYTATFNNPAIESGTKDWMYFEGIKYKVTDDKIKLGLPALIASNVGGKIYFDDIEIKEFDPNGHYTKTVFSSSLNSTNGWSFWSSNNSGTSGLSSTTGTSNNTSLYIEGANGDCNLSNYNQKFFTKQGYSYQINGWMKGENISANAGCRLRIDFLTSPNPIQKRNKAYLEYLLKKYADWGKSKNVPLYMGEFGLGVHCFENNKGGLQWVTDMVDIAKANEFHFTYHVYHEDSFGLYYGNGTLPNPSNANQLLINLFKLKLK